MDIEQILDDVRHEPPWRWVANREMAYKDCNQLDAGLLRAMEAVGMLPIQRPMIGAIMDSVLGVEAMTRRDWVVLANEEDDSDEAKALSRRLKEVERLAGADEAISGAYEGQACVGVGWVEVGRNRDPFGYPHRCRPPHRREVWWDWRAGSEPDEWRYVVRRRWHDVDILTRMFPGKRGLIMRSSRLDRPDWASDVASAQGGIRDDDEELWRAGAREVEVERDTAFADADWRDTERSRLCLWEVWYREYDNGRVLRLPDMEDTVIELDPKNPRHSMLIEAGLAYDEPAIIPRMRLAWWLGPHKLADVASPYPHEEFPYVPFLGFTEDRTGLFYGLIRRMMSGQDQVNAGLTKMFYLMAQTMVMGDEDAFAVPLDDIAERIGLKNSVIPLNPDRKNRNQKPEITTDRQLAAQHFQALQEAQQTLGPNAGVHNAYQGKGMDDQSGVAINSLVEQSTIGLAKLNSRYGWARKKVGELLLANEIERMSGREFYEVIEVDRAKKPVYFNRVEPDPATGEDVLTNDLAQLRTRIELADAPATATFKQQMARGLMELAQTLPDELKALLIPSLVRAGDLPEREEIAQMFERHMGLDGKQDPAQVLSQQREQALEQRMRALQLDAEGAKVREGNAKADKLEAEVERLRAEIAQMSENLRMFANQNAMARTTGMTIMPQSPAPGAGQPLG